MCLVILAAFLNDDDDPAILLWAELPIHITCGSLFLIASTTTKKMGDNLSRITIYTGRTTQ
jgi:hypothetical protein